MVLPLCPANLPLAAYRVGLGGGIARGFSQPRQKAMVRQRLQAFVAAVYSTCWYRAGVTSPHTGICLTPAGAALHLGV
jgi:hypothetical protein